MRARPRAAHQATSGWTTDCEPQHQRMSTHAEPSSDKFGNAWLGFGESLGVSSKIGLATTTRGRSRPALRNLQTRTKFGPHGVAQRRRHRKVLHSAPLA